MEVPTAIIGGGRARSPAFGRLTGSKVTKMSEPTQIPRTVRPIWSTSARSPRRTESPAAASTCSPPRSSSSRVVRAKKGDVIGIARVAAIMASKRTSDLVPLCHPIGLTRVAVDFELDEKTHAVAVRHADGRRDGGAHGRAGRPAHDLRHVQGRRPRHGDDRHTRGLSERDGGKSAAGRLKGPEAAFSPH